MQRLLVPLFLLLIRTLAPGYIPKHAIDKCLLLELFGLLVEFNSFKKQGFGLSNL